MTIETLAENIRTVDRHYAAELKRVDEFYGHRIDTLLERVEALEKTLTEMAARLQKLERK